jgi:hypothetical protein
VSRLFIRKQSWGILIVSAFVFPVGLVALQLGKPQLAELVSNFDHHHLATGRIAETGADTQRNESEAPAVAMRPSPIFLMTTHHELGQFSGPIDIQAALFTRTISPPAGEMVRWIMGGTVAEAKSLARSRKYLDVVSDRESSLISFVYDILNDCPGPSTEPCYLTSDGSYGEWSEAADLMRTYAANAEYESAGDVMGCAAMNLSDRISEREYLDCLSMHREQLELSSRH